MKRKDYNRLNLLILLGWNTISSSMFRGVIIGCRFIFLEKKVG